VEGGVGAGTREGDEVEDGDEGLLHYITIAIKPSTTSCREHNHAIIDDKIETTPADADADAEFRVQGKWDECSVASRGRTFHEIFMNRSLLLFHILFFCLCF
jgi:hypothetical protein